MRNLDLTISVTDHSVPEDGAEFIPHWSKEPSGCKLPRKQWVQLNRLRSRSGRFADDMHRLGFSETRACDCGSELQTYTHILQECPIRKSPNHLTEVDNPFFAKLSTKLQFLTRAVFFFVFMFFLCLYV